MKAKSQAQSKPWLRQPGESEKAFAAFETFLHMEATKRSIRGAYDRTTAPNKTKKVSKWWYAWKKDHNWLERVRAHDNRLHEVSQKATEDITAKQARRRCEAKDDLWEAGKALFKKAMRMLEIDLDKTAWTVKDAGPLMKVAKECLSLASDLSTERVDIRAEVPEYLQEIAREYGVDISEVRADFDGVMERIRQKKIQAKMKEIN